MRYRFQEINGGLRPMVGEIASSSACSRLQQPSGGGGGGGGAAERKLARPQKDQALNCPRCHSTNTKFCYYNNYSLTQPRYFCKTCRRYWTNGGTLRNVPVGGGSRKNKQRSTSTTTASSHKLIPDLNPPNLSHDHQFTSGNPNNKMMMNNEGGQDLNLGFPPGSQHHHLYHLHFELPNNGQLKSSSSSSSATHIPTPFAALQLLRTGLAASRGMNSNNFMTSAGGSTPPDLNAIYTNTSGFSFQELKPAGALKFSVDGLVGGSSTRGGGGGINDQENGTAGRLMFPFGAMKQAAAAASPPPPSSSTAVVDDHQDNINRGQLSSSNGFNWNGMLGGGGSW